MKIELRNVKYAEFASEETACFEASVYLDGKRAGDVHNDGHGGCNYYNPPALGQRLDEHAKTLPDIVTDYPDPNDPAKKMTLPMNADLLIDTVFELWLRQRTDKRLERKLLKDLGQRFIYTKRGERGFYETKRCTARQMALPEATIRAALKDGVGVILNFLPREEAVRIYLEGNEP